MEMNTDFKWYAVYTRPKWEKKVAGLFTKKSFECYCPLNTVYRQWSDRVKVILEPLFTSYVFIRIQKTNQIDVLRTDGVINFLYWLGKPAIIKDGEIEAIKGFLDENQNVELEKTAVNVNDNVRIIHGPLNLREGSVLEVMNNTVKVVLPSLGQVMIAKVHRNHVEKLFNQQEA